jgi:hypothetical protein
MNFDLRKAGPRDTEKVVRLLRLFLCTFLFQVAIAQKISFPSAQSEAKSPNGRYLIRNLDDEKQEPAHNLRLINTTNGLATKIYSYGRHVDILWSPASNAFVVNDYEASNASRPVLFVEPWTAPVDLRQKLVDFLSARHEGGFLENDHVYISVEKWINAGEILCKATGYGEVNAKGFSKHYIYKIGTGFLPTR